MTFLSAHLRAAARRRYLLVVAAVVLAVAGSLAVGVAEPTKYVSTVILVVPSGGRPGAASEADNLAATYAALIPQDQQVQLAAGSAAGMSSTQAGQAISVTVESGSAILTVRFTAGSAAKAYLGAQAVATAVTGRPVTRAIITGSLVIVAKAQPATSSASSPLKRLVLGGMLGLLLGLVLAVAWERSDPRIDDLDELSELVDSPCSSGDLAPGAAASLVQDWVVAGGDYMRAGLLIVGQPDRTALVAFRRSLEAASDHQVELSELDFAALGSQSLVGRYNPIVALVAVGSTRSSLVKRVRELSDLGGRVNWALLMPAASSPRSPKRSRGSGARRTARSGPPSAQAPRPPRPTPSVRLQARSPGAARSPAPGPRSAEASEPSAPTARPR
ncbi:MAG: hypothetical protein ACLPQS_03695 [Acidimicrobiales bacterium]